MESNNQPRLRTGKVENYMSSTLSPSKSTPPAKLDPDARKQSYAMAIRNDLSENPPPTSPVTPQPKKASEPRKVHYNRGKNWAFVPTPMSSFKTGQIFRAVLKHPYHENQPLYPRCYLVVGKLPFDDLSFPHIVPQEICVVGLETNSGQGRYCYEGDRLRFVKGIKRFAPMDQHDRNSFYVAKNSDWDPKENTVVDLTTVLKVTSGLPDIEVEMLATLTAGSITDIDKCYTALGSPPPANFGPLMKIRTQKVRRAPEEALCRCCYCEGGKQCPLSNVFGKPKTGTPYLPEESRATVSLYGWKSTDKAFWDDRSHEIKGLVPESESIEPNDFPTIRSSWDAVYDK
jgi:hypothetical protein